MTTSPYQPPKIHLAIDSLTFEVLAAFSSREAAETYRDNGNHHLIIDSMEIW